MTRTSFLCAACAAVGVTLSGGARADGQSAGAASALAPSETPIDVALVEPPRPRRDVTVSWNFAALVGSKFELDLAILLENHHVVTVSPFVATTATAPIFVFDDA